MGERQQGEERMEEGLVTLLTQALDLPWLPLYLTRYFEKYYSLITVQCFWSIIFVSNYQFLKS